MKKVKLNTDRANSPANRKTLPYSTAEWIGFLFLLLLSTSLLFYMAWSFLSPILFAGIFAGSCFPMLNFISEKTGWKRWISAAIVLIILCLVIFLPSIYVVVRLSKEILNVYANLQAVITEKNIEELLFGANWFADLMSKFFQFINQEYSRENLQKIALDGLSALSSGSLQMVNSAISNLFQFFFQFFLMLIALFGILLNGPELKSFIFRFSPIRDEDEQEILDRFNRMNYVTIVHNGIAALIQGIVAGLGLWVAGISSVMLWTVLMIILALLPFVGIAVVYVPACIYLAIKGQFVASAILFVYCTAISVLVENWYKPTFMAKGISIDGFLVFFSIIGGVTAFGMAGVFYGPLVLTVFLTVASLYIKKYESSLVAKKEKVK
ncbi:hypothetical protein CH373_01060 [Leptospira perolatii]|uniref:AI-2E family transporter n=1 Tax=Leptospira perolatii TaxID=2023191 RepID=A0A2M9ZRS6_9LEPT|nr:AI-2E family transporter [Leptospira perolatii]PJZ71138.1 hypothetical protein CH360_01060 [Leptospira perolatii]PJZ74671.1 hypothetical protein CH373_01060 [Leptospira perolatii]